jgi:uncharacterized membrane protein
MSTLSIATIFSVGLMIGVEFAVWVFINPILWRLQEAAQRQAVQLFAQRLGKAMPFWYTGNFLLLVAETFIFRARPVVQLLATASGIWTAVIILTLIFLVPINNRLARPDSALSFDQAHRLHLRWHAMHRVRVIALVAAFLLLLIALRV